MPLYLAARSLSLNNVHESHKIANQPQSRMADAVSTTPLTTSLTTPVRLQTSLMISSVQPSAAAMSMDPKADSQLASFGDDLLSSSRQSITTDSEPQAQQLINELAARDQEVRQHELAHAAAGGQYAGAPTFEYQRGPDGRLYAVGGEVHIDTSPIPDDPQATLEKAEVILRAALAVTEPSSQDRSVAAQAAMMATEARAELARESRALDDDDENQRDTDQFREERRTEELQNRIKEQQEQESAQAETRQEFNQKLAEVNLKLAEINQKMIDSGVFKKLFDEGFIFDEIV